MSTGMNRLVAAVGVSALFALSACSSSASPASSAAGSVGAGGTTVDVTLQEFSVLPAQDSAPAGEITFSVTNEGPDEVHEMVILKTDMAAADLPTDEHGVLDESADGIEAIDEIEDLAVGATEDLTVNLEAGKYVLVCNIFDATTNESHFQQGMFTAFTVE